MRQQWSSMYRRLCDRIAHARVRLWSALIFHEITHVERSAEGLRAAYCRDPSPENERRLREAFARLASLYDRILYGPDAVPEDEWWGTLGVARDASIEHIKRAYRQLAKRFHPDAVGPGRETAFSRLRSAYAAALRERLKH